MNRSAAISVIVLVVALVALGAALFWPDPEPAEAGGGMGGGFRFPVTTMLVESRPVVESVELVGDVVSARRSTLAFDRSGTVRAVHVRLGDTVEKNTLLAELDDRVLAERLASAQAAVQVAAEEAEYAQKEAKRASEVGNDVVSESDRDRTSSDAAVAEARLLQRRAEAAQLQAELEQGRLYAPFTGVIAQRMLDEGAQAGPNAPIFDLVDPKYREVRLEVPAPLVASIGVGAKASLSLDHQPGWSYETTLDAMVPAADPGSRSFSAVIRLESAAGGNEAVDPTAALLPGLFVRARLTLTEVDGHPVVPIDALVESERGAVVYVATPPQADENGEVDPSQAPTASLVPVRVLARNASEVALTPFQPGALVAGQAVVVTGVQNIFPGANLGVQVAATPAAPGPEAGSQQ